MLSDTPGTPGRSAQMPRTIRSICTPAREASYSASITCGSVSAFIRATMRPALARARAASRADQLQQARVQREGRLQQQAQLRRPRQAGELQEDLVHVQADGFVRRSAGRSRCRRARSAGGSCRCRGGSSGGCPRLRAAPPGSSSRASCSRPRRTSRARRLPAGGWRGSMLASSSKRARSSMMVVTSLPLCAAATSASTMGESAPVRYSVCLMASTCGSAAARRRKSITGAKLWKGWCSSTSPARSCSNRSHAPASGWRQCRREGRVLQVAAPGQLVDRRQPVQVHRARRRGTGPARPARTAAAGNRTMSLGQSIEVSSRTAAP